MDQQITKLHSKEVPLVKVIWEKHEMLKAIWELEQIMHEKYPTLFGRID